MSHWNELTDEEFIAASKEFTSKESFARSFGLGKAHRSFNDRLVRLKISYSMREKYGSVSKREIH